MNMKTVKKAGEIKRDGGRIYVRTNDTQIRPLSHFMHHELSQIRPPSRN